jgi:hypothetical protein
MRTSAPAWLYGMAIFLGAALLFSIEPMIGKMVLPVLGGTPGVWNTCMVFYQAALLAGYAYAHFGTSWLGLRGQAALHAGLLAAASLFLPVSISTSLYDVSSSPGVGPAPRLFGALFAGAGLPFFAVAATAPLLQRWYSLGGHAGSHDPYFLYAASNSGSLLGLLAYPWAIEPSLPLSRQSWAWKIGFAGLAVLILACAAISWRRPGSHGRASPGDACDGHPPSHREIAKWILLAFIPSSWLLAVTTYVTTDLASMPLLWTIPLALYLLTYILAFASRTRRASWLAPAVLPLVVVPLVMVLATGFPHLIWIPLHWLAFFVGALICHGELAASRPAARHATGYYLAIALGGALGGAFNALVAPLVFDRIVEYPLAVVLGCLVAPGVSRTEIDRGLRSRILDVLIPISMFALTTALVLQGREGVDTIPGAVGVMVACGLGLYACVTGLRRPPRFALSVGGVLLASGLAPSVGGRVILRERNFFGTASVMHDEEANVHRLFHGNTLHGQQSLDPEGRHEPSTYFTRSGPIGQLFAAIGPGLERAGSRVAIVGLGAGTLACYAAPGQRWTFYEIDPAVVRIADDPRFFTYLPDCRARGVEVDVVEGDARLRLADAPEHAYRLIILDAFSSDAVPVHLLSCEAIRLYRSKLAAGGLLAFNVSNRYLDLEPVMGRQAADAGLACRICYDVNPTADERRAGKQPTIWVVMGGSEAEFGGLATDPRWRVPRVREKSRPWTDDFSDLASYLVPGGRRFPIPPSSSGEGPGKADSDGR